MIRVLVADDESLIRAGVIAILRTDPDLDIVAEVSDGAAAVEAVRVHLPDVAVLDIRMPVQDGIAAAAEIRRLHPETAVTILTTFGEDANIARALESGATGFVLKAGDPQDLITAVKAVADGAAYLSPRVARRVIGQVSAADQALRDNAKERVAALTEREREVLVLLVRGLTNAQIAADMQLVVGTVKAYVGSLLTRLGVQNRVQAAILGYQAGL
jgi:DNA-binding NarL/FixJ family response regulator